MKAGPAAIVELLLRFFGEAAMPDYSAAERCVARDIYGALRDSVSAMWSLDDLTDTQYDLGWSWWLTRPSETINVRLSFVGPYAVFLNPEQTSVVEHDELRGLIEADGFNLLDVETLQVPIRIWTPVFEGPLYELLFEFDRGSPWAR